MQGCDTLKICSSMSDFVLRHAFDVDVMGVSDFPAVAHVLERGSVFLGTRDYPIPRQLWNDHDHPFLSHPDRSYLKYKPQSLMFERLLAPNFIREYLQSWDFWASYFSSSPKFSKFITSKFPFPSIFEFCAAVVVLYCFSCYSFTIAQCSTVLSCW